MVTTIYVHSFCFLYAIFNHGNACCLITLFVLPGSCLINYLFHDCIVSSARYYFVLQALLHHVHCHVHPLLLYIVAKQFFFTDFGKNAHRVR